MRPNLKDARAVERHLKRIALRDGFIVTIRRRGFTPVEDMYINFAGYGIDAEAVCTRSHEVIILKYYVHPDPEILYWTFQHERGHIQHARARWTEFKTIDNMTGEIIAWVNAIKNAEADGVELTHKVRVFMDDMLSTYQG